MNIITFIYCVGPLIVIMYCGYCLSKTTNLYKLEKTLNVPKALSIAYEISSLVLWLTIFSIMANHLQLNLTSSVLAMLTSICCLYTTYSAYNEHNRSILFKTLRIAITLLLAYTMSILFA